MGIAVVIHDLGTVIHDLGTVSKSILDYLSSRHGTASMWSAVSVVDRIRMLCSTRKRTSM